MIKCDEIYRCLFTDMLVANKYHENRVSCIHFPSTGRGRAQTSYWIYACSMVSAVAVNLCSGTACGMLAPAYSLAVLALSKMGKCDLLRTCAAISAAVLQYSMHPSWLAGVPGTVLAHSRPIYDNRSSNLC